MRVGRLLRQNCRCFSGKGRGEEMKWCRVPSKRRGKKSGGRDGNSQEKGREESDLEGREMTTEGGCFVLPLSRRSEGRKEREDDLASH